MAATYRALSLATAVGTNKSMLGILNTASQTLRIWRVWVYPNVTAVTGIPIRFGLRLLSNLTAGSAVTPIKLDTNSANLSGVTCVTGGTATATATFFSFMMSSEELTVSSATNQALGALVPFSLVWDTGYGDTNVEPITLLQNQGFDVVIEGGNGTLAGNFDIKIEFTIG